MAVTEASKTAPQPADSLTGKPLPGRLISFEEFLVWSGDETHAEWVDGRVVPMSPISLFHQLVSGFLLDLIRYHVNQRTLGLVVYEPFQMKTGPSLPSRAPDILFVAKENLHRLKSTHLEGPADLVVEVISPESRGRDRGEKFYEYEEGGVREYWLVDAPGKRVEFYQLGPDQRFNLVQPGPNGRYHSAVLPGFWLRPDWLWKEPHPPLPEILKEWES